MGKRNRKVQASNLFVHIITCSSFIKSYFFVCFHKTMPLKHFYCTAHKNIK